MKKLLYTFFFFLIVSNVRAQENRGTLVPAKVFARTLMIGGSLTGSYRGLSDNQIPDTGIGSRLQLDLDAKVGYFIKHDLGVGGRVAITHFQERAPSDTASYRRTFILGGPFVRYFLNNGFFGEASIGYGVNNRLNGSKARLYEGKGGVGYAFFLNKKVSVEPMVNFTYLREYRIDGSNNTRYVNEFGPSFTIGMQIYLYRESKLRIHYQDRL